jgi:Zn-dependent protease with chaperone function
MKVLVDTCVWSQLLRKATDENDPIILELNELIKEYRVQMIGPIRQKFISTAHMFIVNPLSGKSMMSLFSTYPQLEQPITRLRGTIPPPAPPQGRQPQRNDAKAKAEAFWDNLSK